MLKDEKENMMAKYYLAPMEGITTYIFRNAYHKYFRKMDKYYTPFFVPHSKRGLNLKEQEEILPAHNAGLFVVPQILSNNGNDCVQTIEKLKRYGYEEINLNFGCPSRTVAPKYRGSGFLAKTEELDRFLDTVFSNEKDVKISVKTRLGRDEPEEFERILSIYNQYPLEELIIHPRVQKDYYMHEVRLSWYAYAEGHSRHSLCYNGELNTVKNIQEMQQRFPQTDCWMIGRGMIANPGLLMELEAEKLKNEKKIQSYGGFSIEKERMAAFLEDICIHYEEASPKEIYVLFKMKEIWTYLMRYYPDHLEKIRKIKKTQTIEEYKREVQEIFTLLR